MAKPNDINHIKKFCDIVWNEVQTRFGEFATPKDVVFHLVERGICEPTRVRNYLILIDFDRLLVENKGHITHTFMDLSIEYNLSDRQIQGIVYKYRNKFHKNHNVKRTEKRKPIKVSKKFVK
tara:strand:+ start:621 stop:986 length:366 start_codon:yes stop_codon:yes gene_type:complete